MSTPRRQLTFYFTAQAGAVGGSGQAKLMALEAKTRQPDAGVPYHSTIYVSCDVKDQASTEIRGIEVSMDGDAGGSATKAYGIKVNNNTSATYTSSYGLAIQGPAAWTADILLASGITISSGTTAPNGTITAPQGSLYIDSDAAADSQLWINTDAGTTWAYFGST